MNSRRTFLRQLGLVGTVVSTSVGHAAETGGQLDSAPPNSRADWLSILQRVAGPVIESLAASLLRQRMPVEAVAGQADNRRRVTHLEAVGRTLAGIAPWLELAPNDGAEADLGKRWAAQARQGLANAADRSSPDYLDFTAGGQCLVDAAFLAHAFLRAPRELWDKLDGSVQTRLVESMKSTRRIKPGNDGSYPVLGRSIAYRCGAFQLLAQMALRNQLPEPLTPAQVRSALSAVIRRTLSAPGTFDSNGWLTIGLAGHQPGVGETYISTGSLYLCSVALLPLGLPAQHRFWADPFTGWTTRKAWAGQNLPADHALPAKR